MKILHTADWHIGKSLYKHGLSDEMQLFFDWLINVIIENKVDVILISGDIFDLANPSNAHRQIYYDVLSRLSETGVQCILTAGNHDSPTLLESPKALLTRHNIHVVGSGEHPEHQIILVEDSHNNQKAVILAVPFLRDSYVRKVQSGESYETRIEGLRQGIVSHYRLLKEKAEQDHPGLPILAMGHLYIQGASLSDSERDIHIGNQAGLAKEHLSDYFDYFALGHIHRPQKMNDKGSCRYSGSPISLSFSERSDQKQVVLLNVSNNKVQNIQTIDIPKFRGLERFKGTIDQIKQQINEYRHSNQLKSLVEIHIQEDRRDHSKILETIALSEQHSPYYSIINYKIEFAESLSVLSDHSLTKQIEELRPREVFESRIGQEALHEDDKKELTEAFETVYQQVTEE